MNKRIYTREDEEPVEDNEVSEKKDRYGEEFYYKILNKNRYILLYDEINNCSGDMVCSKLRAMDYLDHTAPISLEINSPGGMVSYGLSIIDTIENIKAPVYTIISGEACSMAAMISIVGNKRFITKNSVWMQHSSSDMLGGYVQHIKDATAFLIKMEERMNKIIKSRTKLSARQMNQIRNGELWLFAKEAKEFGIVDKII